MSQISWYAYDAVHHTDASSEKHADGDRPMKRITITVQPEDYAAMTRVAKDNDVTVSWLIRRLMRDFLERHEHGGSFRLELGRLRKPAAAGA